jgi:hypothetical protein
MLDASFSIFIPQINALPNSIRIVRNSLAAGLSSVAWCSEVPNFDLSSMTVRIDRNWGSLDCLGPKAIRSITTNIPLDTKAQQTYTYANESYI